MDNVQKGNNFLFLQVCVSVSSVKFVLLSSSSRVLWIFFASFLLSPLHCVMKGCFLKPGASVCGNMMIMQTSRWGSQHWRRCLLDRRQGVSQSWLPKEKKISAVLLVALYHDFYLLNIYLISWNHFSSLRERFQTTASTSVGIRCSLYDVGLVLNVWK
jgi:hypothetical protein